MNENLMKTREELLQEKRACLEEYEKEVEKAIKKVSQLAAGRQWEQVEGKVEKIFDEIQNMAFMDGYQYAISVLIDGLGNMK